MKKTIRRNLYAAVDVMAVVTLLLLVAFVAKKESKLFFGACITGGIGFLLTGVQGFKGQAKIANESGSVIHTKSEDGCDATELSDGCLRYDIDGVKNHGTVYKVGNGCHAVARKDGTVKVKSLTGKLANYINGGGVLTTPPDECWRTLFNA